MSLYDDIEPEKDKREEVAGWASGIKLLQSQMQLRKATQVQPSKEKARKVASLAPVVDLKSRKEEDSSSCIPAIIPPAVISPATPRNRKDNRSSNKSVLASDPDWVVDNEYDPFCPNDYEKVILEIRPKNETNDWKKSSEKKEEEPKPLKEVGGFSRVPGQDEDDDEDPTLKNRRVGAAIAPPPSLQEETPEEPRVATPPPPPSGGFSIGGVGGTIAAKIMAKYGYKEGQGLGKSEQGISTALQVEKTSKRGGRIIAEQQKQNEPTNVTEAMKNPSKVVLLTNMVGPGEVDAELEPEVREECSTKYGDVTQCVIFEIPSAEPTEAVRIFVEFKRQESAIKAMVDLNGRYFGGRMVRASFYPIEKLKNFELTD